MLKGVTIDKSWKSEKLMEPIVDNNNSRNNSSCESSFCKDEKVEAMDLLEECWFFENLLNIKKPKMPRCYSDPCPSTTGLINPDFLAKDTDLSSSTSKAPRNGGSENPKRIQRAPSMPPLRGSTEEDGDKQGSRLVRQPSDPVMVVKVASSCKQPHDCSEMKGNHKSDCNRRKSKLLRTPSLPPSIGREEKFQVSDPRIGSRSHKQHYKSCSIPRCPSARNFETESIINTEGIKEMRRRYLNQKTMMRRSLSDLELEEVQGFKDLGFSFEKESLSPSLTSIIPGLQEKNREETEHDKASRRPYLSEAWLVQSCCALPPPIPNWGSKKSSSASDMKEQIKFWARAVASNVHQEC